jgi:hypothetical protein
MDLLVALRTESDEILFGVIAKPTSRRDVVNFKVGKRTTTLAAPPVAFQYRVM